MYKCSYKLVVTKDKPLLAANIGKCYSDTNKDDNNGVNNSITLSITGVNPIYTNNFHLSPKIQTNWKLKYEVSFKNRNWQAADQSAIYKAQPRRWTTENKSSDNRVEGWTWVLILSIVCQFIIIHSWTLQIY